MCTLYTVYTALSQIVRMYCQQVLHYACVYSSFHRFQVGFIASNVSPVPIVFC